MGTGVFVGIGARMVALRRRTVLPDMAIAFGDPGSKEGLGINVHYRSDCPVDSVRNLEVFPVTLRSNEIRVSRCLPCAGNGLPRRGAADLVCSKRRSLETPEIATCFLVAPRLAP